MSLRDKIIYSVLLLIMVAPCCADGDEPDRSAAQAITDGKFAEAAVLAAQERQSIADINGVDHWKTRDAHQLLSALQTIANATSVDQEQFRSAWRWLAEPASGPDEATYAKAVNFLERRIRNATTLRAMLHERRSFQEFRAGRYVSAKDYAARGLDTYRSRPETHPGIGRTLETIALCDMFLSHDKDAELRFRQALSAFEQSLGHRDKRTINCKSHLAYLLCTSGKHEEADPMLSQVRDFNLKAYGELHPKSLKATLFCGVNFVQSGDVVRGIEVIRRTIALAAKKGDEPGLFQATCEGHLGNALRLQGRYADAEIAFAKSLAIFKKRRGATHTQTCACMWNLAFVQYLQNDFKAALAMAADLLDAQKAMGRNRSLKLTMDASELAYECGRHLGKRPNARKYEMLLRNGLRFHEERTGRKHAQTGSAMVRLARLLAETDREQEATELYRDAAQIFEQSVGEFDSQTIACRQLLGNLYRRQGDHDAAIRELTMASDAFEASRHRRGFAGLEHLSSLSIDKTSPTLAVMLAQRGKAVDAWYQLEKWRARRLEDEIRQGPREAPKSDQSATARELLARVQKAVPDDAALVTWIGIWFQRQFRGEVWACVVRSEGDPQWISMRGQNGDGSFSLEQMRRDQQIMRNLNGENVGSTVWDDQLVKTLAQERIVPLAPLLAANDTLPAVRNLIVSLPGPCDIPLEMLTDHFVISYVPSMTFLAWQTERRAKMNPSAERNSATTLLAIGDPNYGDSQLAKESMLAISLSARDAARKRYSPLPGTRNEIEAIAEMFERDSVKTLLGDAASESAVENLSEANALRDFRFLHFAAHGESNPDVPMQSAILLSQPRTGPIAASLNAESIDDGRITAEQVRNWDLAAELVTLSACETGLGPRIRGKHFVGFSQAFLIAGAESVVVSNWQVRDDATSLLMRRFYQNLLGRRDSLDGPLGKAESLAEAKKWLRNLTIEDVDQLLDDLPPNVRSTVERRRANVKIRLAKPFENPYFWAPFVLIGDRN